MTTEFNYPVYDIYQNIYDILSEIDDVNPKRSASGQRWIYPTLPSSLDENYPRITLKILSVNFEGFSAGMFLKKTSNSRYDGNIIVADFWIGVFIKKEQSFPIFINGAVRNVKNELLAEYMANQVIKKLKEKYLTLASNDIIINPSNISFTPAFEYDTHRIITEISFPVRTYDYQRRIYLPDELIETVNLNIGGA